MSERRAAPALRSVTALAAMELRLAARRGESLVVTMLLPAAVLLFFGTVALLPVDLDRLLASSLAIAVVATGLVSLGISTAYDRYYGVLKRLGGAPIPAWGIVAARLIAVLATVAVQSVLLVVVASTALSWRAAPAASAVGLIAAIGLGTAAFAGAGLILASRLRAETTLAAANGLFVALLLAGGLLVPAGQLPAPLGSLAAALPSAALVDAIAVALAGPQAASPASLPILAGWSVVLALLAARSFRVE